jgi:hypothetical protein
LKLFCFAFGLGQIQFQSVHGLSGKSRRSTSRKMKADNLQRSSILTARRWLGDFESQDRHPIELIQNGWSLMARHFRIVSDSGNKYRRHWQRKNLPMAIRRFGNENRLVCRMVAP